MNCRNPKHLQSGFAQMVKIGTHTRDRLKYIVGKGKKMPFYPYHPLFPQCYQKPLSFNGCKNLGVILIKVK